jgi:hypothetical protein
MINILIRSRNNLNQSNISSTSLSIVNHQSLQEEKAISRLLSDRYDLASNAGSHEPTAYMYIFPTRYRANRRVVLSLALLAPVTPIKPDGATPARKCCRGERVWNKRGRRGLITNLVCYMYRCTCLPPPQIAVPWRMHACFPRLPQTRP